MTAGRWARKWKNILLDLVSYVGIYWLFVEISSYSTDGKVDSYLKQVWLFLAVFLLCIILASLKNKPKRRFGYRVRDKDSFIEVKVGDAFDGSGALVVPVNNEFDMSLGGNVLKVNSIQAQLIKRYYSSRAEHLATDVSAVAESGNAYEIGKTIEVEQSGKKFYLLVNSTKGENNRVKSDINDFLQALTGLWLYLAYETSRDSSVTIPLINTQHGRDAYLSRSSAVREIITSYIEFSKSNDICERLIIVIHPSDLEKGDIDLDEIDDFLRFSCKHYRQLTLREKTDDPDSQSSVVRIDN
jgi:hypothetical protein